MNLFMVGVDHTSAPVAVRECLAFSDADLSNALSLLTVSHDGCPPLLQEAVILSTCNRVELYGLSDDPNAEQRVVEFLAHFHNVPLERFAASLIFCRDEEVVRHLFETTAGLRSIVLGEAQIQGQARKAFAFAQRMRSAGPILSRLFNRAIITGKRVRHETNLGEGAASVSQAAIELAEQRLGSLEGCTIVLVGSGKVSELAAQNLLAHGAQHLIVVNRTFENALELAGRYGAQAYKFADLPLALSQADIVISSTSAPTTILHRHQIEAALESRAVVNQEARSVGEDSPSTTVEGGMLLIDLAVPRDIDADVADIPGVHLYTVDDLRNVVSDTLSRRSAAVTAANQIVSEEVEEFNAWLRSQDALPVLSSWRQQAEQMRHEEVERALRRLATLSPEQQYVVEALSRSLVNKLLHSPTLRTKHAASLGEGQRYTGMIRDLWGF